MVYLELNHVSTKRKLPMDGDTVIFVSLKDADAADTLHIPDDLSSVQTARGGHPL